MNNYTVHPIDRIAHGEAIQALMDTLDGELFPAGWDRVLLEDIPVAPDDIWLGAFDQEEWMRGIVYALPSFGVHHLHLVFSLELRGHDLLPVLHQAADHLFNSGIVELYALIPPQWRHVRWLAGAFGFHHCLNAHHWFMSRNDWLIQQAA